MFILLNMSKKLESFNFYLNNFYPLKREYVLDYIDYSKEYDENSINFNDIRQRIESCLDNSKTSKYSIIILYDFSMQKNNPLIYSTTGILNNIEQHIVEKLRHSFILENLFFVSLDDVERDYDNQLIDETLKNNVDFDKYGYLKDCDDDLFANQDYDYFIKETDFKNFKRILKKSFVNNKKEDENKVFQEFVNEYVTPIETRVNNSFKNIKNDNNSWYIAKFKKMLSEFNKDVKNGISKICDGDKSIESINFGLNDFASLYLSSFSNYKNKIFRLNMLDQEGKFCRNEAKYRNYFKIISFVNYICKEDKKYIFSNSVNNNQNHYSIEINILDETINDMYNLFYNNLKNELNKLGDVKFKDIQIEEYEYHTCDTHIPNDKKYDNVKPKFTFLKNSNNAKAINEYVDKLKNRYIDQVNYCNQRLRKITDKLRVEMHKSFSGKKFNVSLNELNRIIDEKQVRHRELKEKIASNTPRDIILIDYELYDEHEKLKKEAIEVLNKRISSQHFIFNIGIILFCSLIFLFMLRRFDLDFISYIYKTVILLTPVITYIFIQLIFSFNKVSKANKVLEMAEIYTKSKINEIDKDDDKFKDYVNDIYELMMLTKYIDKLNLDANYSSREIENYRYQKDMLENVLSDMKSLANLLRIDLNELYDKSYFIPININKKLEENDAYCPLLYLSSDYDNYILINNQHKEKLKSNLLNIVENIKFNYDEVVYGD